MKFDFNPLKKDLGPHRHDHPTQIDPDHRRVDHDRGVDRVAAPERRKSQRKISEEIHDREHLNVKRRKLRKGNIN